MPARTLLEGGLDVSLAGRPVLHLVPEGPLARTGTGRVRVGLVLPEIGRIVDITAHPAAALARLRGAANRSGVEVESAERLAREVLVTATERSGAWCGESPVGLQGLLGGASFPMLGAAYDRGASPVGEVPRWAVPALAAGSAREAAAAVFGSMATRPVVSALARGLVVGDAPTTRLALHPLGLGLIGAPVLDPDRLARVLEAAGDDDTPHDALGVDQIAAGRSWATEVGAARAARLLSEAARTVENLRLFLEVVRMWTWVSPLLPERLPNRLRELHDLCRSLVVTDRHPSAHVRGAPAPPPRPAPGCAHAMIVPPPRSAEPEPAAPEPGSAEQARRRELTPPVAFAMLPLFTPIPVTRRAAGIDGTEVGGLRLVLPRTCGDLERWGRLLRNCVGSFDRSAVEGRSVLVGVFRGPDLRACLELTDQGVVRQFLGPANRQVPPATRRHVLGALAATGAVDRHAAANRPWLDHDRTSAAP